VRTVLDRLFKTVPELDRADNRAGITFVNILFGLVVTQAAIQLAGELVKLWVLHGPEVDDARVSHLLVAITLAVLSWIGYHQSQHYPPFLIKFINIPFIQFFLDVLMVLLYYVVVATAENTTAKNGAILNTSAKPEAILVFGAFLLYVAWDFLGFRLFRDRQYTSRFQTPRPPDKSFGPRRWVSVIFTLLAGLLAAGVWFSDPSTPRTVIAIDGVIIGLLFLYRIAKQGVDPKVKTRTA
jgi:hypothetical protein